MDDHFGSNMTTLIERDGGFCSGGDEDEGFCSHTDASDDSADLKIRAVSFLRNKRKCAEPRRVETDLPAKKRRVECIETTAAPVEPFRPWSGSPMKTQRFPNKLIPWLSETKSDEKIRSPVSVPVIVAPHLSRLVGEQEEPLSLVAKHKISKSNNEPSFKIDSILSAVKKDNDDKCAVLVNPKEQRSSRSSHGGQQRNYKNMTRERRIEANARERTRVHTISAAFDTLRHSIPAYSHNQKLSKLSVLRIACSYIKTLSRLAGENLSPEVAETSLSKCVENVSRTIQTEGKVRKKKDE